MTLRFTPNIDPTLLSIRVAALDAAARVALEGETVLTTTVRAKKFERYLKDGE